MARSGLLSLGALLVLLAPLGCSTNTTSSLSPGGGSRDGSAGTAGLDSSVSDAAARDASAARDTAASNAAPGRYLTDAGTSGGGACLGVTLTDVLAKIRSLEPSLADIVKIYNPAGGVGDGSFIYPYTRSDGGFDIVFKRGLGDCPAGCTENDYLYYSTDEACLPQKVGHFHAAWGVGSCLDVDGAPLWNHPPAPDPLTVCGQDNAPAALDGTWRLRALGQRSPCSTVGGAKASTIDATVTVVVTQDAKDPSMGFVTFSGTGHPLVDGVPIPARFQRQRFDAALKATNVPSQCPRESSVTARFDFEGYQSGGLELGELGNEACELCKGSMSLSLTL